MLLLKNVLITSMPVKSTIVLQLDSYWSKKISIALSAIMKGFPKLLVAT